MLRNYAMFLGFIMFVFPAQTRGYDFFNPDTPDKLFTPSEHVHVLPKYSSLGKGFEFRSPLSDTINWRYEYYGYSASNQRTKNNVVINANQSLRSSGLLLDWHPFPGIFRISAGIIAGKHELSGSAHYDKTYVQSGQSFAASNLPLELNAPFLSDSQLEQYEVTRQEYEIAKQKYEVMRQEYAIARQALPADAAIMFDDISISAQDLVQAHARVTFPSSMPYFGIGWGNAINRSTRFRYSIDFGFVYRGQADVELALTGPVADVAGRYASTEYRAYLNGEEQKLERELEKYRYYPVISTGLSYLF